MSLDGFIADDAGRTGFLVSEPAHDAAPFFASIDSVIMGRHTYEAAIRQGLRAYPGLRNYVVSRTLRQVEFPEVTILEQNAAETIAALRRESGKDIWLCGGGTLFLSLLAAGLVDTVEVGVSPILLGRPGVPMLGCGAPLPAAVRLELTRQQAFPTGLVVLEYVVRAAAG